MTIRKTKMDVVVIALVSRLNFARKAFPEIRIVNE